MGVPSGVVLLDPVLAAGRPNAGFVLVVLKEPNPNAGGPAGVVPALGVAGDPNDNDGVAFGGVFGGETTFTAGFPAGALVNGSMWGYESFLLFVTW